MGDRDGKRWKYMGLVEFFCELFAMGAVASIGQNLYLKCELILDTATGFNTQAREIE